MEILYPRCAGLDVHKETVAACILLSDAGAEPRQFIEQFGTTTGELRRLREWLREHRVTHAAMESTGVYWKPVFNILESACQLMLVNARHIQQVPGRKTDKADCARIASLLRHGLLQASFVPEEAVRELRDLCRMRTTLVRECVQVGNRVRKVLEDANLKLDSVASDAFGVSGRSMIMAIVEGQHDAAELAQLARGRLRAKLGELEKALEGRGTPHHRFMLAELMRQFAFLEGQVERFEAAINEHMRPFEWAVALLVTMPGVDRTAACALIAEIGVDMSRFATSRYVASWAGLCPGNNESAGKRRSGKSHRGNRWIKGLMTEIAWAATRKKDSYAHTQYRNLIGHRGKKRALVALANSLLQAAWHMLSGHHADGGKIPAVARQHPVNSAPLGNGSDSSIDQSEVETLELRIQLQCPRDVSWQWQLVFVARRRVKNLGDEFAHRLTFRSQEVVHFRGNESGDDYGGRRCQDSFVFWEARLAARGAGERA